MMKGVCDTPSSDGACVCEVLLNHLDRIRSYGWDNRKFTDIWMYVTNRQTKTTS